MIMNKGAYDEPFLTALIFERNHRIVQRFVDFNSRTRENHIISLSSGNKIIMNKGASAPNILVLSLRIDNS